ncbi:MAG: IclR family transcriptional regulator [bacterium]|nr:IclR family transcriptional regulator [bacterium]
MAPTYHLVQSLIKSLAIMEYLAESTEGLGVTEIGDAVGLNKSTVHRILTTLVHEKYVEQDHAKGRYRLSFKLFELSRKILNNVRATKVISPYLEKLAAETGESARFVVPDYESSRLVVCDEVMTSKPIKVRSHLGESLSLSKSAAGKMFLASLTDDEIKELMDQRGRKFVLEDENYNFSQLKHDLIAVRETGHAYEKSEDTTEPVVNIAAPIRDESGKIVAILDLFAPTFRSPKDFNNRYGKLVRETAMDISKRLGYIAA